MNISSSNGSNSNRDGNSKIKPAAFLDRDGLIINFVPRLKNIEDVQLREGVGAAIASLNQMGYWVFVVTNQPHIASGELTPFQLDLIHSYLSALLLQSNAKLDKIYYCPHVSKDQCSCRKPSIGMLEQASKDFQIQKQDSFMVGDTWRDVECGKKFGIKSYAATGGNGYPYDESVNIIADSKAPENLPIPDMLFKGLPQLVSYLRQFNA
jgi:D-glycero-D-manno-heptose 1,7-bisphosphate phosphatase